MRGVIIINRKLAIIACLLVMVLFVSVFICELSSKYTIHSNFKRLLEINTYIEPSVPPECSLEEMYRDSVISLLYPYISDAIENYYRQPFHHDPWSDIILSIERQGASHFLIKLEVMPYYGPHNSVGIDHITISIAPTEVKIEKFEHIKTYFIPPKPKTP
jgi:hypothetical protein